MKSICVCKVVNNAYVKCHYWDLATLKIIWRHVTSNWRRMMASTFISIIEVRIHVWRAGWPIFSTGNTSWGIRSLTIAMNNFHWAVWGCRAGTHHWLEMVILAFPTPVWCIHIGLVTQPCHDLVVTSERVEFCCRRNRAKPFWSHKACCRNNLIFSTLCLKLARLSVGFLLKSNTMALYPFGSIAWDSKAKCQWFYIFVIVDKFLKQLIFPDTKNSRKHEWIDNNWEHRGLTKRSFSLLML